MIPYFYLIQHKLNKKLYAGCKYGRKADPSNFMKPHGYKTSSKTIHKEIEKHGLDVFEILILKTEKECNMHVHTYESRWLKDHDCIRRKEYYNMNGNWHPSPSSPEFKYILMKKYGVKNAIHIPWVKDKIRNTVIEKYGAKDIMSSEHFKQSKQLTLMQKYGVSNVSEIESVKDKRKATFFKKYGFTNNMFTDEFKEARKKTFNENYGVDNPSQNQEIKNKKKSSFLEHYGVDNYSKTLEARERASRVAKIARSNDPIRTCPHCGKVGKGGAMLQWHFDRCKLLVRKYDSRS